VEGRRRGVENAAKVGDGVGFGHAATLRADGPKGAPSHRCPAPR
jgi:hypothetical protein